MSEAIGYLGGQQQGIAGSTVADLPRLVHGQTSPPSWKRTSSNRSSVGTHEYAVIDLLVQRKVPRIGHVNR
jgi:hypothetical protein